MEIFLNKNRKMKKKKKNYFKVCWYEGTTGLPPLDHAIKNALKHGWSHHIERLYDLI